MTPQDDYAFVGDPPLFRPEADEVHISVTFTWDKKEGERLVEAWSQYYDNVKLGGVAYASKGEFIPGRYIKQGVTFTTRGCNNNCSFCLVPLNEGRLIEINDFAPGWIIQDNNLLQASHEHIEKVFEMLKKQNRPAEFSGGIQASLVDDWFVEQLKTIRISQLFMAADTINSLRPLEKALQKLRFLGRNKLRVYTLIGLSSMDECVERLKTVWNMGGLPFAQLYQPEDRLIEYSKEWRNLARVWSRPAIIKTIMKDDPLYKDEG